MCFFRDNFYPNLTARCITGIYQNIRNLTSEKRQRLILVFKAVEVIMHREWHPIPVEETMKCLKMEFETIPEPLITREEIEFFLKIFLNEASHGNIQEICNEYEFQYPESTGPLKPRSLLHLSRCQVRQNLRSTGALPYGVQTLEIPESLKEYILIEWYRNV